MKATKIYKNQVVMFCFCSNEMQPCRIWGAKQKLNPIANNPCLYTLHLTPYTLHSTLNLCLRIRRGVYWAKVAF